jgi:hypothetical protein
MALLDVFRNAPNPASGAQPASVLVCSIGTSSEAELAEDAAVYQRFFQNTAVRPSLDMASLMQALTDGYSIVHILANVDAQGRVASTDTTGAALIAHATANGTKLLWLASSNAPDGYIAGFQPGKHRINVVMTIDRQGAALPKFLNDLLARMQRGMKMPMAWNDIAPQIPGSVQPDTPEKIYAAGYGAATFF